MTNPNPRAFAAIALSDFDDGDHETPAFGATAAEAYDAAIAAYAASLSVVYNDDTDAAEHGVRDMVDNGDLRIVIVPLV